jgi:hypothetical protein
MSFQLLQLHYKLHFNVDMLEIGIFQSSMATRYLRTNRTHSSIPVKAFVELPFSNHIYVVVEKHYFPSPKFKFAGSQIYTLL